MIVTALALEDLPMVRSPLYKDVIGPHVKLAQDLVLPLTKGLPVGDPIAEVVLSPNEKRHRLAYRALLRDAVANRIRALGGEVIKKNAELCGLKFLYDVTLSEDKRILMIFPQGDTSPLKALSALMFLKERLEYIELKGKKIKLRGPVSLEELRGGRFPEPQILLLDENDRLVRTSDPLKPFIEGRGRAIEGGEDIGRRVTVRLFSDSPEILKVVEEFAEEFFYGHGSRGGYMDVMRTEVDLDGGRVIEDPEELYKRLVPDGFSFVVLSREDVKAYRKIRSISAKLRSQVHMLKLESIQEFREALRRNKLCGMAALAIDVHKKLGMIPYKLDEKAIEALFGSVPKVYGITQAGKAYVMVSYESRGKFLEAFITPDIEEIRERLEEGSIVYSQGVRELSWKSGAVLYVDRKTPVGIIEDLKPARGAYFFTPWEAFVVTGFNCRTLRIRIINSRKYKAYNLALYTYRSSRLLQRDFPILVPPVIRAIDRIREHIENGIIPAKITSRPRFLRVPYLSPGP